MKTSNAHPNMKKNEIIKKPCDHHTHVVLLGAGASVAAFPNGDANGKHLPHMVNLVKILKLEALLREHGVSASENFEVIYSNLENNDLKKRIEDEIFDYFKSLYFPAKATIYDKLLLSLREKDSVFTFNWDPFLFDAYMRNMDKGISLPEIFFLHGNVRIGSCTNCNKWGGINHTCSSCSQNYTAVPLLYPIKNKDYFTKNKYTALMWDEAKSRFAEAFFISIFGYGAPESDVEAIDIIKEGWFAKSKREFEHFEVIDVKKPEELDLAWQPFTPTWHLSYWDKFEDSYLGRYPRRTCEGLFYSKSGTPCEIFPLVETNDLNSLQDAARKIAQSESKL
jgi:hypothetical protein